MYYSNETGVPHEYWQEITHTKHGIAARTAQNIFHKRDSNEKGQQYNSEFEYRFAMILGNRYFFGDDSNIALSADDAILRDYLLILRNKKHYIEKVYLRVNHPDIEATCWFAGIEVIKITETIAV